MCAQGYDPKYAQYDPGRNMPIEMFMQVGRELFPKAINVDLRGFGESTILPYWPDIVDSLESYPFIEWNLVTNLSLTRDDVWEKMMRVGFVVGFSCDGASKETFESIRRGGSFAQSRHNLAVIRDAIKKHRNGYLYINCTVQRSNIHEMRALVELAHEFGVIELQFSCRSRGRPRHRGGGLRANEPGAHGRQRERRDRCGARSWVYLRFGDPIFLRRADPEKVKRVTLSRHRRGTATNTSSGPI